MVQTVAARWSELEKKPCLPAGATYQGRPDTPVAAVPCHGVLGTCPVQGRRWRRVVLTTTYSGMDFPGVALSMLRHFFLECGWQLEVQCYSAADIDESCRHALLQKPPERGGPEHVFGSVLDRVPPTLRDGLLLQLSQLRSLVRRSVWATDRLKGKKAASARRKDLILKLGSRFLEHAAAQVSNAEMSQLGWCYRHQTFCSIRPPVDENALHVEVAGTTCVAFSHMTPSCIGFSCLPAGLSSRVHHANT